MMDCPACYCPFDIEVGVCPDCGHVLKSPDKLALDRARRQKYLGTLTCILAACLVFVTRKYLLSWALCTFGLSLLASGIRSYQVTLERMLRAGKRIVDRRSVAERYGSALMSALMAATVRLMLDPILGHHAPFPVFMVVVMYVAWHEGLGPALLVTTIGVAITDYFYIMPLNSFAITSLTTAARLAFMLSLGLLAALFCHAQRKLFFPEPRRMSLDRLGDPDYRLDTRRDLHHDPVHEVVPSLLKTG